MPTLTAQRARRYDPTHTLTIQRAFERDIGRRTLRLISEIRHAIVTLDVFGLKQPSPPPKPVKMRINLGEREFVFDTDERKMQHFMRWLRQRINSGFLEANEVDGVWSPIGREPWTNTYIRSAYQKGIANARKSINDEAKMGLETNDAAIESAFNQPIHANRVATMFSRTFEDLVDTTRAMQTQIRRTLLDGLAAGRHPNVIAKQLNNHVKKIGRSRARTIARTEIIRAHHKANIGEFRNAGMAGVRVQAEFMSVNDGNVCPECADLEFRAEPWSLDEIENLIPVHPNCRCTAVPVTASTYEQESRTLQKGDLQ